MAGWSGLVSFLAKMSSLPGGKRAPASEPRQVFRRFLRVLRSNNQALELIADIGEKMSGEYLFDRRYIEETVGRLSAQVRESVDALVALDSRHQDLLPVYDRLTDRLQAVLAGREDREGPGIVLLEEVDPLQWAIVGGKGAHLSEMIRRLDVAVPPGFIITTCSYHDLIDHSGLRPLVSRFEELWAAGDGASGELELVREELAGALPGAAPPPGFSDQLAAALAKLAAAGPLPLRLAVRSSAREEDLDFSFAGQYETVLNVEGEVPALYRAYLQVVASLFRPQAVAYRRRLFPQEGHTSVACVCQRMIDSRSSGVAYSTDPVRPGGDRAVVVGAWGQGAGVVEGGIPADTFYLSRNSPHDVVESQVIGKTTAYFLSAGGGLEERRLDVETAGRPCLDESSLMELGRRVVQIENFFKRPQDIEWTFDGQGRLFILQARPLTLSAAGGTDGVLPEDLERYERIAVDEGRVAQQGIGCGPVHIVRTEEDLDSFPDGAVLVGRRDSSRFVRVMHRAAAIVTEIGTPASHMSTLCRELNIPCLVSLPRLIDRVRNGEEVTVDAEDRVIYRGRVTELLAYRLSAATSLGTAPEFRLLRRLLQSVARLHLVDPLMDDFASENCRTYHDLLRYVHEAAVRALVEVGKDERNLLRRRFARRLELPVPAGIMVLDIGGGLSPKAPRDRITLDDVTSVPLRAIVGGMLTPGAWHLSSMPVGIRDLMSSMLSAPKDVLDGQYTGHNVAVAGANYVNLCFRFGYHFNIVDAYCGDVERENHIYFRFLGGATDLTKRSRRARLIAEILTRLEFSVRTRGDLVIARAGNMARSEIEEALDAIGRLVGFTRQLDVCLDSEAKVDRFVQAFLRGDYRVAGRGCA